MTQIRAFRSEHSFLSNFHPCEIAIGDLVAPSVEHAYQALKTLSAEEAKWVLEAESPVTAKRRGRRVTLRPDWPVVHMQGMEQALRLKFAPGSDLAAKLLATGDAELVEGNNWNDTYWGVCKGRGQNHLGRLLMKIRAELRDLETQFPRMAPSDRLVPVPHPIAPTGAQIPPKAARKSCRPRRVGPAVVTDDEDVPTLLAAGRAPSLD